MNDISLELRNMAAIKEAHDKWLNPPEEFNWCLACGTPREFDGSCNCILPREDIERRRAS